jgi:predicted ester cyclase
MSEENKAALRRWYDSLNRGDPDFDFLAPDLVDHSRPPGVPAGREGVIAGLEMWARSFSDLQVTIEEMVAEGDKVALRSSQSFRHTGEFQGIPATGREVTVPAMAIVRFSEGRAVEYREVSDGAVLMEQLQAAAAAEVG